jgi:hypothetical protein
MNETLVWQFPIRTVSEANRRDHWAKASRRHRMQKFLVQQALKCEIKAIKLPCHIKITRIAPRCMNYDNLVSSQKYVLDAICDLILPGLAPGRADDDPRITASYFQEKGKPQQVRIEMSY